MTGKIVHPGNFERDRQLLGLFNYEKFASLTSRSKSPVYRVIVMFCAVSRCVGCAGSRTGHRPGERPCMKPAPAPRPLSPSRHAFVQGGAVSAFTAARYTRVPSANDRVGVGFIGPGLIGKRRRAAIAWRSSVTCPTCRHGSAASFAGIRRESWSSTVREPRGCANVPIVHPGMGSSRDWEWAELMTPSRREFLAACAGAIPALAGESPRGGEGNADDQPSLGVVIHTYSGRVAADRARGGSNRLDDPLNFLEYCHAMGVRGVQVAIGVRDSAYSERLAKRAAAYGMYLEGIVRLPRNRTDMERFRDEVGTAFLAGARVLQTTLMDGHRYKTFTTAAAFRRFADAAFESLALAKEVLATFGMTLAIENHKDLPPAN